MPQFPIPNDWDGETYECYMIEWPFSVQWNGLLRGLISTPTRGRFWDGSTGSIKDIQAVGEKILERNPVTTCEDLVTEMMLLRLAVQNMDINSTAQIAIQTNIENNIDIVSTAISTSLAAQSNAMIVANNINATAEAVAFAWSQSMAKNLIGVTIINNTQAQFRPIEVGVDSPPEAAEEAPTGITATLEPVDVTNICRRAYWIVANALDFFNYMEKQRQSLASTTLGLMGVVADGLFVAGVRADPVSRRFLIPAAAILGFTHNILTLYRENIDPLLLLNDWMNARYEDIVCSLAQGIESLEDTDALRERVLASAIGFGLSPSVASLAFIMFNYSSLAALYYVSPLLDPAPAIPVSERADICDFCGG